MHEDRGIQLFQGDLIGQEKQLLFRANNSTPSYTSKTQVYLILIVKLGNSKGDHAVSPVISADSVEVYL